MDFFETRRQAIAAELKQTVDDIQAFQARPGADVQSDEYRALRERRGTLQESLTDAIATLEARKLAQFTPARPDNGGVSDMRRVLREYDRGNSERFDVPYELRELQTGDPYFTPPPTRIPVASLPVLTPSLDLVRSVQTANQYDFVVPPPISSVANDVVEGAKKPTTDWVSTKVSGSLTTQAVIIDTTRQTLEDDASAERTLRAWLTDAVRGKQDRNVAAAIAGATGTGTATGASVAEGLRNAKAELSELGLPATAAYLHPSDAAELDLGAYTANGDVSGFSTVWGMRIVESTSIAVNAPIVGAMSTAVYFLYRNAIATYLTDTGTTDEVTPRDRFSHNLIGILAEGRSKAHVVFPQALVKVTITP